MLRVYSILYTERLWYANQHGNSKGVTQSTSDQPFYTSSIPEPSYQENYHYEASVEESEHDSFEDEESEIEGPHGQISKAVLRIESNQPEEQEIIPCQHPHSIFEQDIQIETSQQQQQQLVQEAQVEQEEQEQEEEQERDLPAVTHIDTKEEELSIEILPNDEEVVESLTIDTSSLKMLPIEKEEEEISLSSSCSTTPPKTPPSSSHNSSFLPKSKTTTSLFRRETTKLNDRRKSLTKKIKKAIHINPTKRFSI